MYHLCEAHSGSVPFGELVHFFPRYTNAGCTVIGTLEHCFGNATTAQCIHIQVQVPACVLVYRQTACTPFQIGVHIQDWVLPRPV